MGAVLQSQIRVKDRLLIVGADGLLGGTLRSYCVEQGQEVVATSLLEVKDAEGVIHLDLAQPAETWPPLPACRRAVLCAAITNLDQCRRDPAGTAHINVVQTLQLARRLVETGCFVVFISSNLVFDGSKPLRHPEEPTCPRTEYGRQKAKGEAELAALRDRFAVVRLTKVLHPNLPLIRGWKQALAEGKQITPFTDFVCSPITLEATVRALATVAEKELSGIWQLSGSADISYAEIAQKMVEGCGYNQALVSPIPAREVAQLEHLPAYSTLDASRAQKRLGFEILPPSAVVDRIISHEN